MSDWTDSLQQASFRGLPFAVLGGDGAHGRRLAVHEYPFKDKPWAEDIGRDTRQFRINGFLITDSAVYGGGDVIDQLNAMIGAAEANGSGTLVHPVLGELTVSIPRGGFTHTMQWDQGRYFAISFVCLESGERDFPSSDSDTGDATDSAADDADQAASEDYVDAMSGTDLLTGISDAISHGAAVVNMVLQTVNSWVGMVIQAATNATSLFNMIVNLPGNFGRFFNGRTVGLSTTALQAQTGATVASLISQGITLQAGVVAACSTLQEAAEGTDPAATATAAQGAVAALLAAMADPQDAVTLLTGLVNFYPAAPTGVSIVGMAEAIVQTATGAMVRRAALAALARATALYQPSSANDAANLKTQVAAIIDSEIDVAGDSGDDASYSALIALRAAVVLDLDTRGAALPALQTVTTNESLPSLVLAQRLYQDVTRADELVTEADPVHPAFMPNSFQALTD